MYILDIDPVLSARYLTIHHVKTYISEIETCLVKYHKNNKPKINNKYNNLYNMIFYSKVNFLWFMNFYDELQEIYKNNISWDNEYKKHVKFFEKSMTQLPTTIYCRKTSPCFTRTLHGKKIIQIAKNLSNTKAEYTNSAITLNRYLYIFKKYNRERFPLGFPHWYKDEILLYEVYSQKDRTKIKVELKNDKFNYYINHYNGDWKKIKDVPKEINILMNSILFPNQNELYYQTEETP